MPDDEINRPILIGPVAFTLVGAGVGVCLAMLYHQEPSERARVSIDDSMPLAVMGAAAGCLVGCFLGAVCTRWPKLVGAAGVVSATLVGAAFMAPIGWIAGDTGTDRLPREGMAGGAVIGAAAGFVVGLVQLFADRRSARHANRPASSQEWFFCRK